MAEDKIKATDQVYPTHGYNSTGINLRTAMAMDAMKGILAGRDTVALTENEINETVENAIRIADKLIEQLNKI